ncbi:prepilin peptidase [Candidatus Peregrinibacteria bacterium]|nr:prepilin peptidase [Candidatus Peregrinibacteria bacterium]
MIYVFVILIGLAFGSFASMLIHRLHTRDKSVLGARSFCPRCAAQLRVRDLIPIASFLINKFRCRFCKQPIAFRYPLLELSMAVIFLLTTSLIGMDDVSQIAFYLLIAFVFIVLTFYDFLFKEIPDLISLPALFIAILYAVLNHTFTVTNLVVGMVIPVVFFGLLHFGSKGRWLGGGDIRVGALMGALLGYPMILTGLFFGYLFGSVYSLIGLASKKFGRQTQIPFAPFLLLGTYVALFWGQQILDWYFALL